MADHTTRKDLAEMLGLFFAANFLAETEGSKGARNIVVFLVGNITQGYYKQ